MSEPASPHEVADEGALVERARRGDRDAFGDLYERHAPALLGVAIRILREPRDAGDLVHDVFLEAWQHVREYDPGRGTVRTWLLLRLRSRALDRLGRAERRHAEPLGEGTARARAVPARAVDAVDALAVRRALDGMDPATREVVEHTYLGGFTAKELAERIGVPVGTVKSRLARGVATLEALLGGEGDG